jgi:hypothetical protein
MQGIGRAATKNIAKQNTAEVQTQQMITIAMRSIQHSVCLASLTTHY